MANLQTSLVLYDPVKIEEHLGKYEKVLERTYNKGPAENFINDGRIQANPPAGLRDFSKALPRFSNRVN